MGTAHPPPGRGPPTGPQRGPNCIWGRLRTGSSDLWQRRPGRGPESHREDREAEVTIPEHRGGKNNGCQQEGYCVATDSLLCPDQDRQEVRSPIITHWKVRAQASPPTREALYFSCIFTDNMTLCFMTTEPLSREMNHVLVHNRENTGQVGGGQGSASQGGGRVTVGS